MWVVLGLLAGLAVLLATEAVPPLAWPLDTLTATVGHAAAGLAAGLFRGFGLGADTPLAHAAAAAAAVVGPSVVGLLLAEAVVTSRAARRAAAALLTLAALASFLWLPGPQALLLLVAALVLDVLLALGRGPLLALPATAAITALTGRLLLDVCHGGARLTAPAGTLAATLGGDPALWRVVLAVAALTPALGAVLLLLRRR